MKKNFHSLLKLLLIGSVVAFPSLIYMMVTANKHNNLEWLLPSLIGLPVIFSFELNKYINNQPIFWGDLTVKDKFVFFISYTFLILCLSLFISVNVNWWLKLLFVAAAYVLYWCFVSYFGSASLRKWALWPKA